jgi:dihydrofolate synthase/folylpolyglutamate synthase
MPPVPESVPGGTVAPSNIYLSKWAPVAGTYEETLRYLWGLNRLGSRPGLATIQSLLDGLGNPEESFRSLHITGSKGKGSTAAFCASVMTRAGARTGLYTSPHLLSYRERIQVDGEPIPKEDVVDGVAEIKSLSTQLLKQGKIERMPTFFEVTTALAFQHFLDSGVDVAVVEVGLGGRLDATNTVESPVCVITTLELEHTDVLGPTLRDIATEKAGIFHRGAWAVCGMEGGEGFDVVRHEAFHLGVPLWQYGREFGITRRIFDHDSQEIDVRTPVRTHTGLTLSMLGEFQARNAGVAVAALDMWGLATGDKVPEEAILEGLAGARWPGRMDRLSTDPPLYADAAHTPESAGEVVRSLTELEEGFLPEESAILFSCLKDKRVSEMLGTLSSLAKTLVLVPLGNERAMPLKEMELGAKAHFPRVVAVESVAQGLHLARIATGDRGLTVATGSIYLVSEVLAQAQGTPVEEPRISDGVSRSRAAASATRRGRPVPR